jgi:hypothetical protein
MGFPCNSDINIKRYNLYNQSLIKRYRFDSMINQCIPFGFFGCGGNFNQFYTETLCTLRCSKNLLFSILCYFC